jgi:hypothetical protein
LVSLSHNEGEERLRGFENRVLGEIFGLKGVEITGDWKRLHNVELYILYSPPNIIRVLKPRRMKQEGHVARIGERDEQTVCWENHNGDFKEIRIDGRIILKWILKK